MTIGPLVESSRAAVEAFLLARIETSMFLLSNLRAAGFAYEGKPLQGTWLGAFDGAQLAGVACHCWNGNLLLQAPGNPAELSRAALEASGRKLEGIIGPLEQVQAAAQALSAGRGLRSEREVLFVLEKLVPPPLASACRLAERRDLEQLAAWRYAYIVELSLGRPGEETRKDAERGIRQSAERKDLFVLELEGRLVATTAFNARLPEIVQIGGVYTPPELRGRGYAKSAVAGSLQLANVKRAVLFTGATSHAAQAAYRAIGFREAGSYGLLLL